MKSLQESLFDSETQMTESLFDTDLVEKDLPTIGSNYKLTSIRILWGDYYVTHNGLEEDLDLVDKMFKVNKLKSVKPISLDNVKLDWYKTNLEFYNPFARLLTLVSNFYFSKNENIERTPRWDEHHRLGLDVCKEDWDKLYPYIYMGKAEIRIWQHPSLSDIHVSVYKNFGSSTKYLQFTAVFEKK